LVDAAIHVGAEGEPPSPLPADTPPALRSVAAMVGRRVRVSVWWWAGGGAGRGGGSPFNRRPPLAPVPPKVSILDGRLLAGTLVCLDPQANLVLADAACLATAGEGGDSAGAAGGGAPPPAPARSAHQLGTIIVTRAQRVACWLEAEPHEAAAWRAALGGG
jgi:small nuclear ribonucleoprotein (snRNP)-like protein